MVMGSIIPYNNGVNSDTDVKNLKWNIVFHKTYINVIHKTNRYYSYETESENMWFTPERWRMHGKEIQFIVRGANGFTFKERRDA